METQKFQFKTNINCGGCVTKVTPYLDKAEGIESWEVDTANRDKILTVNSTNIDADKIIATVKEAGFNIEQI
ncbi:heavy-metal-associated domain-containing protein [Sphingobacterium faecale]|uniref:Heavy-metal-associated domain-containing protein n=1 Tax=Sphingobacterium faecale TaxID=2803775 RepID=A0ABS1R2A8_9SPHI|nr:heavy-metal-associated domain-containing protein [Sphingobacterium faecale]MBL1408026.1 heavy-metal-associated domain-containing protein [Sphingobacterium faecale]